MKILITERQLRSLTNSLLNEANKYDVLIKLGFNPEQSKILDDIAGKLSLFFMNKLKDKYGNQLNNEQWAELVNKDKLFDKEKNDIQYILDWFKGGLNGNFKQFEKLSFDELYKKSDEWHNSLKAEGGDYNYEEKGDIIIDYRNNGLGYYWVNLDKSYCDAESKRMGHCGRGRGKLYSLRSVKKINDQTTVNDSHLTADISIYGRINQLRGKNNSKPAEKYSNYILDLLTYKEPNGEYLVQEIPEVDEKNFSLNDFNDKLLLDLFKERPDVYDEYMRRNNKGDVILDYGNGYYWVILSGSEYVLKGKQSLNNDRYRYVDHLKINIIKSLTITYHKKPIKEYSKYIVDFMKSDYFPFKRFVSNDLNSENVFNVIAAIVIDTVNDYDGYISLFGLPITKLPENLIEINNSLNLENTKIKSLGNLKRVKHDLILQNTPITSLGNLEKVGSLKLKNTLITDLGNLKEVTNTLSLEDTQIKDLGNLEYVWVLKLKNSQITSLGNLKKVGSDLHLQDTQIKSLGTLEYVGHSLYLQDTQIKSLGTLEYVGHSLYLQDTQIESLGNLRYVGTLLHIKGSELAKRYSIQQLEERYPQFKGKFVI